MNRILFACVFLVGYVQSQAQSIKSQEVPSVVTSAFNALYPDATKIKWEMEDGMYEADFVSNQVETSVLYSRSAVLAHIETKVETSTLPAGIMSYIAINLSGAKMSEASKIIDSLGIVSYEVEVNEDDYLFTSTGQFLSKEEQDDDDDDDDND